MEWEQEQLAATQKRAKTEMSSNKITVKGEVLYVVESVLDEREEGGKRELYIKWKGYDQTQNTWEPFKNIPDILVDEYRARQQSQSRESMKERHSVLDQVYNYETVDVILKGDDREYVDEGLVKFATSVIDGLQRQFPGDTGSILAAFDIFHLDSLNEFANSEAWEERKDSYGLDELQVLISHFGEFLYDDGPPAKVETEKQWVLFREQMWKQKMDLESNPDKRVDKETREKRSWFDLTCEFWSLHLNMPGPHHNHFVLKLVSIFLVLVLSSVPCERYFRKMNLQKDLLRTRMRTVVLDDRMMIAENGPELDDKDHIEAIIELAYQLWLSRKKRVPNNSRQEARPERRKKKKDSELSGLLLERGPDSDDLTDDEDHGDMKCHCKVRSNQIQETQDFEPRNVLTPDEGWTVIQVSAGNVRQTIESAIESSDIRVSIQYPSGWNSTGQVVSVEQGLCDHLRVYKGWVWVRLVEEGETTKSEHLCA